MALIHSITSWRSVQRLMVFQCPFLDAFIAISSATLFLVPVCSVGHSQAIALPRVSHKHTIALRRR